MIMKIIILIVSSLLVPLFCSISGINVAAFAPVVNVGCLHQCPGQGRKLFLLAVSSSANLGDDNAAVRTTTSSITADNAKSSSIPPLHSCNVGKEQQQKEDSAIRRSILVGSGCGTIATIFSSSSDDIANAAPATPLPPLAPPPANMMPPKKGKPVVVAFNDNQWTTTSTGMINTELGKNRILSSELSPLQPSFLGRGDNDIYYPSYMEGTWKVTSTLKRKYYPYGLEFSPSNSLIEGSPRNRFESVGDTTEYEVRFVNLNGNDSTLPVTVISDRPFNAISASTAYKQLVKVTDVLNYNPKEDPSRLTLYFGPSPLSDDMMPLGPRRTEIYITARRIESSSDSAAFFCAAEKKRSVTLSPGNVVVSETESITEYSVVDNSSLTAISRIAVYLTPNPNSREGVLWQQVNGKAIAFFDYDMKYTKL